MAKYYLCFECENEFGKKEVYPILKASLEVLDMYTCYCKDEHDLFDKLPNGKVVVDNPYNKVALPDVKSFIYNHFKVNPGEYSFYLREDNGNDVRLGRKKIPVLYSDNRDVVYINKGTNEDELLNVLLDLKMTISECNNANLRSIDTIENEKNKVKFDFFRNIIEKIEKRNNKLVGMFERNCGDFIQNKVYLLATSTTNLVVLAKEAKKNPMLRRELVLDIKDVIKKLDDFEHEKTRLISKEEAYKRQSQKEQITKFRISLVMKNIGELLLEEEKYYNKKYNINNNEDIKGFVHEEEDMNEVLIDDKKILDYNKLRFKNNDSFNDILDLMAEIEEQKTELIELEKEEKKYQDVIDKGSFVVSNDKAKKALENIKETKRKLINKINELEYNFQQLEEGNAVYSDAGFIIDAEDKKY